MKSEGMAVPKLGWSTPTLKSFGTVAEITQSEICKNAGTGDTITIGTTVITGIPGSSVISCS